MKSLVAALVLTAIAASPAMAAKKVAPRVCHAPEQNLTKMLDQVHHKVPDVEVKEIRNTDQVAIGAKFINAQPPATHYHGDAIVVLWSPSEPDVGYVVLVSGPCAGPTVKLTGAGLEHFIKLVTGQDASSDDRSI